MKLQRLLLSALILTPGCEGNNTPSFCYRTTPDNVCPEIWSDASCAPTGRAELGYFLRATAFANDCAKVGRSEIGTFGGDGKTGGYDVVDITLPDQKTHWISFYTQPRDDESNYGGGLVSISVIPGSAPGCGQVWYGPPIANFKGAMNAMQACPWVKSLTR